MFQIDNDFLDDAGFGDMSCRDKEDLLLCIEGELQARIGAAISGSMSDDQLARFDALVSQNQQQLALQWLEENCAGYRQAVAAEVDRMKTEILCSKEAIISSTI